jgi:hypothetical protein
MGELHADSKTDDTISLKTFAYNIDNVPVIGTGDA